MQRFVDAQLCAFDLAGVAEAAVGAVIGAVAREVQWGVQQHLPPADVRRCADDAERLLRQLRRLLDELLQRELGIEQRLEFGDVESLGLTRDAGRSIGTTGNAVGRQVEGVDERAGVGVACVRIVLEQLVSPAFESLGEVCVVGQGALSQRRLGLREQPEMGRCVLVGRSDPVGEIREHGGVGERHGLRVRESKVIGNGMRHSRVSICR